MDRAHKIHVTYVISILLAIIVMLITIQWGEIKDLVNYITFALTITSLILAILAISYSVYSNTSMTSSLTSISNSAKDIRGAAKEIEYSNKELRTEIACIPTSINQVEQKLTKTQSLLEEMSSYKSAEAAPVDRQEFITTEIPDNKILDFLENSSMLGLYSILFTVLARETKTPLNYIEVSDKIPEFAKNRDYMYAYYIAVLSLGLITVNSEGGDELITEVHSILVANTEKTIVKNLKENLPNSGDRRTKKLARYFGIKRYFGLESEEFV
jgi:hypothetical protein